jgi:uncharacterized protein with von Willebrand factor type A (vWA) domain
MPRSSLLRPEQFYYLARATFVHDESQLDRFDRVFAEVFKGLILSGGKSAPEFPRTGCGW